MATAPPAGTFHGWRVVGGAFTLATFGWGIAFYGPPIYLHAIRDARGWPVALVSAAMTVHFVVGALVVANLPALYRRLGLATVTKAGALLLALGVIGWSLAAAPWQLFAATLPSGEKTTPPMLAPLYAVASAAGRRRTNQGETISLTATPPIAAQPAPLGNVAAKSCHGAAASDQPMTPSASISAPALVTVARPSRR